VHTTSQVLPVQFRDAHETDILRSFKHKTIVFYLCVEYRWSRSSDRGEWLTVI